MDLGLPSLFERLDRNDLNVDQLIAAAETLRQSGRLADITLLYKAWLDRNTAHPLAHAVWFNFGVSLADNGELLGAIAALNQATTLVPDFHHPYINLGNYYERIGRADLAIESWKKLHDRLAAITHASVGFKVEALKQIARVLEKLNDGANAEQILSSLLQVDPQNPEAIQHWIAIRQRECLWPLLPEVDLADRRRLLAQISPLSLATYLDDPVLQIANAYRYNRDVLGWPDFNNDVYEHQPPAATPSRLKIGYVSSDLRDHAVGFSLPEVLELHDREKVEIFAYYCGSVPGEDATQARIKASVDHWTDISGMGDAQAAQIIHEDGIHILLDLNGYTKDARTKIFARRPAPINVNWFGYPGTMGSPYHHYIIADKIIIPAGFEEFYSEKVLHLPCYQPNDRGRILSPNAPSRSDEGLPEGKVVFCSLNGLQKLNSAIFGRWMQILAQVDGSVLWLLTGSEAANDRLRGQAEDLGIDPTRLIFAQKKPNPEHVARYQLADLFLDNLPYGAHTTAADSLWMGVPVLTCPGTSFASRVCASLVHAAGTAELVVASLEDYVQTAISLGNNPQKLVSLKQRLLANRNTSRLFDAANLVVHLEGLYQTMWQDFAGGRLPEPRLQNLDLKHHIGLSQPAGASPCRSADEIAAVYGTGLRKWALAR